MQLDKTAVVIAQRTGTELVDLSLSVVRQYFGAIAILAILGVLPFAILDFILLWPLTQYDNLLMSTRDYGNTEIFHFRFLCIVTGLILIQAPMALCGVTYYIGQAVFIERPSIREVFGSIWQRFGAIVWILGIWRMGLVAYLPAFFLFIDPDFRPEIEVTFYLIGLCGMVFLIRGFRPFASEILLLERCPLWKPKSKPDQLVYSVRSRSIHSSLYNELLGIHIGVTVVQFLTAISLTMGLLFFIGVLTGIWQWGPWMDLALFPLVVWIVACWGTIIRFLNYMNSRIRIEGWEIELRLKAEAQRLGEVPQ